MEWADLTVVVMDYKNTSASLIQCVDSIINQTYQGIIEILVLDMNMSYGRTSFEVMMALSNFLEFDQSSYENKNNHTLFTQEEKKDGYNKRSIRVINNYERNQGQVRNNLLNQINSKYISFTTTDEVWRERKANTQIQELELLNNIYACCCDGLQIDKRKYPYMERQLMTNFEHDTRKWMVNNPAIMPSQVIYRVDILKEIGGFDKNLTNFLDGDALIRIHEYISKENDIEKIKIKFNHYKLCTTYLTDSTINYEINQQKDLHRMYVKYLEEFIYGPLSILYYRKIIALAFETKRWLHWMGYGGIFLFKHPYTYVSSALDNIFKFVKNIGKTLFFIVIILMTKFHIELIKRKKIVVEDYEREEIKQSEIRHKQESRSNETFYREKQNENLNNENFYRKKKKNNIHLEFKDDIYFNKMFFLTYTKNRNIRTVTVPTTVTRIKPYMFYGCTFLEKIILPHTLNSIGKYAFYGCINLKEVVFLPSSLMEEECAINNNLRTIDAFAFARCSSLTSITLPSSLVNLQTGAFFSCSSLKEIYFEKIENKKVIESPIFPMDIKLMNPYVFAKCSSLTSIIFTNDSRLESIKKGAFYGCTSLKKVFIPSRIKELGEKAFYQCQQLKHLDLIQIDDILSIGSSCFMHCKKLEYFILPKELIKIEARTFYGCSSLRSQKLHKSIRMIGHQAYKKCDMLDKITVYSSATLLSSEIKDKHTEIEYTIKEMDGEPYSKDYE